MDFTVKPHVHARLALLAAVLLTATAGAQSLADPTRPPDAPLAGSGSGAIVTRAAPQLQSVLVSSSGRRVAVIDGRTVRVGDKLGEFIVAGIADTSVTLRRGKTIETIRLYPKAAEQNHAGK
ncbi:MSHA biogenesis protein MshK [Janthinobacterium sp.]|jgi:MSHA biogenesis protein MshK|uniref:MSHA biogenesis protein MshK n=1 Tax=Janthinobacterium sp. TaxID=1871054 RepID=UPI00289D8D04|nr:MSHA biogenesis protein MshK [Janthinobacterium sp.]